MKAFFVTIPHSGEKVPAETHWLDGLSEAHLMRDVDRYVDRLYQPVIEKLQIPSVVTEWHRYVIDLNRRVTDVDCESVKGSENPAGQHPTGLHWSVTTQGEKLIPEPMSAELHQQLIQSYYVPWHEQVEKTYQRFVDEGAQKIYQLDGHSMPSQGTDKHRDPGEKRAEIVISDVDGVSCEAEFKDLVMTSYAEAGFQVAYNWPYKGGGVTQKYGQPQRGRNCIQVELNRRLYMNEDTKKLLSAESQEVTAKLSHAVERIYKEI